MNKIPVLDYSPLKLTDLKPLTFGHPHSEAKKQKVLGVPAAVVLFVSSILCYLACGVVGILSPPRAASTAGGVSIPEDATCLRATRHADYTEIDIAMGTPSQQLHLLLRPDKVLGKTDAETAMRVFSQQAMESTTVFCTQAGSCEDVVMTTDGVNGVQRRNVARFSYRHAAVESSLYTTASSISGVDGELAFREGFAYWITATHLCYANATSWGASGGPHTLAARVSTTGFVVTNRTNMLVDNRIASAPAASSDLTSACNAVDVEVFPVAAGNEAARLSITDSSVYNSEPESVESRRTIVEVGATCANHSASLSRELMLYRLDCSPYSSCVEQPNLPFRRVATSSLCVVAHTGGSVDIATLHVESLEGLAKLAESTDAFLISLVKLIMITLAAAVVYVRSKRFTASSSWLVKHCISTASVRGQMAKTDNDMSFSITEDRFVGIIAFSARAAIALYRIGALSQDGQLRVCVTELIASVLSAVHLVLRYCGLKRDNELPISKLGGSTAVLDSTAAVMVSFAEPPSLVSSIGRFDATARMLVALLISLIVVTRCAFSASCCGVLWESETDTSRRVYAFMLVYAGIVWNLQCALLGILMADLFVSPSAYSMSRSIEGDATQARVLLFLAFVCAGLPRLMTTVRHIISENDHLD